MHVFKSEIAKILPKMAYFSSFFPRLLFLARNSSYRNSSFLVSHRGIDQPRLNATFFVCFFNRSLSNCTFVRILEHCATQTRITNYYHDEFTIFTYSICGFTLLIIIFLPFPYLIVSVQNIFQCIVITPVVYILKIAYQMNFRVCAR